MAICRAYYYNPTIVAIKNTILQRYFKVSGGPSHGPHGPWLLAVKIF
jgi:hypothetical protein